MMKASTRFGLIMLFIGIAIGAAITWALEPFGGAQVHVLEGYTTAVNNDGTAIGLLEEPGEAGEGYIIAGAVWGGSGGSWHDTFPTCLKPLTDNQKVRLGVVKVAPTQAAPGQAVVVWLECLD